MAIERNEFIALLNSEISQIGEQIKSPGWTPWAILATIGALAWRLLDFYSEQNTDSGITVAAVLSILALVSLLEDLRLFYGLLQSEEPEKESARYVSTRTFAYDAPKLAFQCLAGVTLVTMTWLSRALFSSHWTFSAAVLEFFPLASSASLALVVSVVNFPLGTDFKIADQVSVRKVLPASLILRCGTAFLCIYGLRHHTLHIPAAELDSLRIAIIAAALYYLVEQLLASHRGQPALDLMITIRRDLLMDRITLSGAVAGFEMAVEGLKYDVFFQGETKQVSQDIETLRKLSAEIERDSKALMDATARSSELTDADLDGVLPLVERVSEKTTRIDQLWQRIEKSMETLQRKLFWAQRIYGRDNPEIKATLATLESRISETRKLHEAASHLVASYLAPLQQLLRKPRG